MKAIKAKHLRMLKCTSQYEFSFKFNLNRPNFRPKEQNHIQRKRGLILDLD